MNENKFGQSLKDLRKSQHLTQNDLADKYHVSYQAVSKWENGQNMPDLDTIQQMARDFNLSVEDLLNGEWHDLSRPLANKKNSRLVILGAALIILMFIAGAWWWGQKQSTSFEFKTLSTTCSEFKISGNISFNQSHSAIYISDIEYCGGNDDTKYQTIECTLYETHADISKKIAAAASPAGETMTLEEFLHHVSLTVDDYAQVCRDYSDNNLLLEINATDANNKITTYKIPLTFDETCVKSELN